MKKGSEGVLPGGQVGFEHVEMMRGVAGKAGPVQGGVSSSGLAQEGSSEVGKEQIHTLSFAPSTNSHEIAILMPT